MKFQKTILTTALIVSTMLLTACNEKKAVSQNNTASQTQAVTNQTENQTPKVETLTLDTFNKSVKIIPNARTMGKNNNNEDSVSFSYTVKNISDKPIKEIQWFAIFNVGSAIVNITNIPAVFETPLQPNAEETVVLTKLVASYPEEIRGLIVDPKTDLSSRTLAGKIIFSDNTEVVVTTIEDIQKALSDKK